MTNKNTRTSDEKGKVDTYLTEIKELPPDEEEPREVLRKKLKPSLIKEEVEKKYSERSDAGSSVGPSPVKEEEISVLEEEEEGQESRLPLSSKDIILGVVNIISAVLLIVILVRFPDRARELKELKLEELKVQSSVPFEFSEVGVSKAKADKLEELFLEEEGIVEFVNEVEKVKNEIGVITKISFASQKAVKDKTGNFGLPVAIELAGGWADIDRGLQRIDKLPFLFRAAKIEIERSEEEVNVIVFKYGIFLYVSDKLGEN